MQLQNVLSIGEFQSYVGHSCRPNASRKRYTVYLICFTASLADLSLIAEMARGVRWKVSSPWSLNIQWDKWDEKEVQFTDCSDFASTL